MSIKESSSINRVVEENIRPYVKTFTDYLKLPDRELKVLLALKSFAWNHKDNCYPSIPNIAKMVGKCTRQVRDILRELEKKEIIRTEAHDGFSSTYYITNKMLPDEKEEKLSTPIRKSSALPRRKSSAPPGGNPPPPPEEILRRSNINNNKKKNNKSFYSLKPQKPKPDQKPSANQKHDFAPMMNEKAHSEENKVYKRAPMPESLRQFVRKLEQSTSH